MNSAQAIKALLDLAHAIRPANEIQTIVQGARCVYEAETGIPYKPDSLQPLGIRLRETTCPYCQSKHADVGFVQVLYTVGDGFDAETKWALGRLYDDRKPGHAIMRPIQADMMAEGINEELPANGIDPDTVCGVDCHRCEKSLPVERV